ncbi:MAG: hypothetical protein QT03_C0001G1244 [archaeon GW2011_AR10]|uniref:Uncharacterized protein n=1 Tax=Candidatus Iainarchaeum sp. TaxID=3101447 RepID=A0A7J4IUW4_9ARCH|nr:MAG: hypothetical protein QT03_C0001G1244 [archaeon GW2011_AR10]HIH08139.1 hypothetical protein [Candidatus Diapherotrites archaeon]
MNINISIEKKPVLALVTLIALVAIFSLVIAYNPNWRITPGNPVTFGHSPDEIGITTVCTLGQALTLTASGWSCVNVGGGGGGLQIDFSDMGQTISSGSDGTLTINTNILPNGDYPYYSVPPGGSKEIIILDSSYANYADTKAVVIATYFEGDGGGPGRVSFYVEAKDSSGSWKVISVDGLHFNAAEGYHQSGAQFIVPAVGKGPADLRIRVQYASGATSIKIILKRVGVIY